MTLVAASMKLRLSTLDTNGKEREARRLHSITITWLSLARNWMLNGPVMFSERATWVVMLRIRRIVSR